MSDFHSLRTDHLWTLACRFARSMFDIGDCNPLASDKYARERIRAAALRLTARVFESFESANASLRQIHLAAAAESAQELRHFLSVADRSTAISPLLLEDAHSLAGQLAHLLANRLEDDRLAQTA